MTHTKFLFSEVPDGDDIVAKCTECSYEILHRHETGEVKVLDWGDLGIGHIVSYIPQDGLRLTIGVSLSETKPGADCGHTSPGCRGST